MDHNRYRGRGIFHARVQRCREGHLDRSEVGRRFTLLFYILMPIAIGGTATTKELSAGSTAYFGPEFTKLLGGGASIAIVLLCISLILVMNSSTADGGRALYGSSVDGLTVKQLGVLNRHRMPGRGMTVDLVINLALVFFVGSPIAVLLAGNLGYFVAMIAAVSAFLLLRKDRPKWPRPIGAVAFGFR